MQHAQPLQQLCHEAQYCAVGSTVPHSCRNISNANSATLNHINYVSVWTEPERPELSSASAEAVVDGLPCCATSATSSKPGSRARLTTYTSAYTCALP